MERTIDKIVQASVLPLSIVIVGVGAADFAAMVSWSYTLIVNYQLRQAWLSPTLVS